MAFAVIVCALGFLSEDFISPYDLFSRILFIVCLLFAFPYIVWLLLKIPILCWKRFKVGAKIKKHPKKFFSFLGILMILLFAWHYVNLWQRISRLENIVGRKKITCNEKESIERAKESLVRIIGVNSEGTGFYVSSTGLIVTNHHVIAEDPRPKVVFPDYSFAQGEVVMANSTADLAFVKIYDKENLPVLSYADSNAIEPMEEIISLGYPLGTMMRGEPTVIKGRFVALRPVREMGINLVQTDISLNQGASGGPMINVCGEVVAINEAGTAGLGMGISVNDFKDKWLEMTWDKEPLKEVKKMVFEPNKSPKDCVEAFYNYQTVGDLQSAYNLLTGNYTQESFEKWQEGYKNTFNVVLSNIVDLGENRVGVKFSSADLVEEEIVYKYFEGIMKVVEINNEYKIDEHEIEEIKEPDFFWFYEPFEEKE